MPEFFFIIDMVVLEKWIENDEDSKQIKKWMD